MNSFRSQSGFPFSETCFSAVHEKLAQRSGGWQGEWRLEVPSDPSQLMPQTGGEDAFHFLHHKVQGRKQSAEESFCEDAH